MDARTVEVRTVEVELGGGRRLHAVRFRDGGRDRLTLATTFDEETPVPGAREGALELPGGVLPELLQALEALTQEDGA